MILSTSEYQRCWSDCAGWSGPLLFANPWRQVFLCYGPYVCVHLIDAYELLWAKRSLPAALSHINYACLVNFYAFVVIWWLFSNQFFLRILSGTLSECQTVCIHLRTDFQLVLIWILTVSKGYLSTDNKVAASMERVHNPLSGLTLRLRTQKLIFLFLNQNICCGYSKEPSQWDGFFKHPKHRFKLMD